MAFDVDGCNDTVLATFAGYADSGVPSSQLNNDREMKRFIKYTSSEYRSRRSHICEGCAKYGDVKAELTGILQVATMPPGATKNNLGFIRDSRGKYLGIYGWGHPVPFAKYRIIIESVRDAEARRLPRPK